MVFAIANQASQAKPVKKAIASTAVLIMEFARKIINASAFWVSKAKTALKDFAQITAMEMENALKINAYVILAGWE